MRTIHAGFILFTLIFVGCEATDETNGGKVTLSTGDTVASASSNNADNDFGSQAWFEALQVDSDNDGESDFKELYVNLPPTDPHNPDNDGDGYHGKADQQDWPSEADCDNNNAAINPGITTDKAGNGADTDCKLDVTEVSHTFGKNYRVEAKLTADAKAIYVKAYYTSGTSNGECQVDPYIPDVPDNQAGSDGCKASKNCALSDYTQQPYVGDHSCKTWRYCDNVTGDPNDVCTAYPEDITPFADHVAHPNGEGIGYKVVNLSIPGRPLWLFEAIGFDKSVYVSSTDMYHNYWGYYSVLLGE